MKISRRLFYRAMEQHIKLYPWGRGRHFQSDAQMTAAQWNTYVSTGKIKARLITKVRLEIMASKPAGYWPVLFKVADVRYQPKPRPKGARKCR